MLGFLIGESPRRKLTTKALKWGLDIFLPQNNSRSKKVEVYRGEIKSPISVEYCRWLSVWGKTQICRGSEVYVWKKHVFPKKMIWRLHDILGWNSYWMCWLIRGWLIKSRFQNYEQLGTLRFHPLGSTPFHKKGLTKETTFCVWNWSSFTKPNNYLEDHPR